MPPKTKILFLAAATGSTRLAEEARQIEKKLNIGDKRDLFEFVTAFSARTNDIQELLQRHQPHILHFSARGTSTKGVLLEDKSGVARPLDIEVLTHLFSILLDNIRIVFMDSWYSKNHAQALAKIVDYTIGISDRVTDDASIEFAAHFYQSLAFGRTIKNAFEAAVNALGLLGIKGSLSFNYFARDEAHVSDRLSPQSVTRRGSTPRRLDFAGALDLMKAQIEERSPQLLSDFLTLEFRLLENLAKERFGYSDNLSAGRLEVVALLNELCLDAKLPKTFNDLVRGS